MRPDSSVPFESPLKKLSIKMADAYTLDKTTFDHPRLSSLEHLSLAGNWGFGDEQVETLAMQLPHVSSLDLSRTDVTGYGIKMVMKRMPGLKNLHVSSDRSIDDDALKVMVGLKNIKVTFEKAEQMKGGRKVRF